MAERDSLESLQALYLDLLALSELRLSSLERLGAQLDAHMQEFRKLLDKQASSQQSRESLRSGRLELDGVQYAINEEFQQNALQLSTELDLDELQAARLFLVAQESSDSCGRSLLLVCLIRFHQRRKCLLDCLRLLLQLSADIDLDETLREDLQDIVAQILQPRDGSARFSARCLASMATIRKWLQDLKERGNPATVLGPQSPDIAQAIEYQRAILVSQHQTLGVIVMYLVKENHASLADFDTILDNLKCADKYDNLLVHNIPSLIASILKFGGVEAVGGFTDAQALHDRLLPSEEKSWVLTYVQASFRVLWLAEYSGWYSDNLDSTLTEIQVEDEARKRSKQFNEALKDGAFDFLLSVSLDVKPVDWYDPARHGLRQWLQRKAPSIVPDTIHFDLFFQEALMAQLESFVDGFITNIPDVLRKLRADEDEQRQLSKDRVHDLDLERFLVIVSNVFEGRPKAALEAFWDVPDGSMIGFVHWASRRASTPLVGAFCEMLRSISEDEECATSAHHFLLDEGAHISGKSRRNQSLTWSIIFKELNFFMKTLNPTLPVPQSFRQAEFNGGLAESEPEFIVMMECYLRLITQLASNSESVRSFFTHHPSFHLIEMLFQLASTDIGSRLRSCALRALRSLLSDKTREIGEYIWLALDAWVSGSYTPGSIMSKVPAPTATATTASMDLILQGLSTGFEEPSAFIELLHALVSPYRDDLGLHDEVPFPENLGSSIRQPGIDVYVDFAVGEIFGRQLTVSSDSEAVQKRLLQLTCLDFISTCLDTFNEDLIVFANQSSVSVDAAIKASTLANYIMLHPFSRVMEWLYSEKIMVSLFAIVHQDPDEVARAAPDSPLILCVLRSLDVISMLIEIQPTYQNIVRPLLKTHSLHRRNPIPSAALESFEDGILRVNRLQIFLDLGYFCGVGHPELAVASLKLLEKLSSCSRLIMPSSFDRESDRNRTLSVLDSDAETISGILLQELKSSIDINQGPESPAYIIKVHILNFILACLRTSPNQPSVAHLLLGFRCDRGNLFIERGSLFAREVSLFHSILELVTDLPMFDETGMASWLVVLHLKALEIIKELWASPISSHITMTEMRTSNFPFAVFSKEEIIQPGTAWDGATLNDPAFTSCPAVSCFSEYLARRALLLQYISAELRQTAHRGSTSLKQRIIGMLLGSTAIADDKVLKHATIFDLFDFMEWELQIPPSLPQFPWLTETDLQACRDAAGGSTTTYDVVKVEELLALKRAENLNLSHTENLDTALVNIQPLEVLKSIADINRVRLFGVARANLLKAWVQLVLLVLQCGDFDDTSRTSFVLRTLQVIMCRLESNNEPVIEAAELARLAKALLFSLKFSSDSFKKTEMVDLVGERLFALFQISLIAINTLGTKISLKEYYYHICFRYMVGMSEAESNGLRRRHNIQTIKSVGDRFIGTICDDASGGDPTCRVSALLVLEALVKMEAREKSNYVTDSLKRVNFISLLVGSIRSIPLELKDTPTKEIPLQLSYCHARLALLLQVSRNLSGALAVYEARLFDHIHDSGLFTVDPELGVNIACDGAVQKYYTLLAAIARVVCTTILVRGSQNQQSLDQGRRFLTVNRLSVLSVLKKSVGLASATDVSKECIGDLADSYLLLISYTGFLDYENQPLQNLPPTASTKFAAFT